MLLNLCKGPPTAGRERRFARRLRGLADDLKESARLACTRAGPMRRAIATREALLSWGYRWIFHNISYANGRLGKLSAAEGSGRQQVRRPRPHAGGLGPAGFDRSQVKRTGSRLRGSTQRC